MGIIRVDKNKNNPYVTLNKTALEDNNLSFKAKGIFAYLMSKPDNWSCKVEDLKNNAKDGRDSIYAGLKELREFGYMIKIATRDTKGQFIWDEVLYETPQIEAMIAYKEQINKKNNKSKTQGKSTTPSISGNSEIGESEKGNTGNIIYTNLLNNYLLNNYCISNSSKDFLISLKGYTEMKIKTLAEYIDSTNIDFIESIINYAISKKAKTIDYILNTVATKIQENIVTAEEFILSIEKHKENLEKKRLEKINNKIAAELDKNLKDKELEDIINYYAIDNSTIDISNFEDINNLKNELKKDIEEIKFNTWIKTLNILKNENFVYIIAANDFSRKKVEGFISNIKKVLSRHNIKLKIKLNIENNVI